MVTLRSRKDAASFYLFVIPGIIMFLWFFILPAFMGVFYSFTDWNGMSPRFNYIGVKNYLEMFKDSRVSYSIIFSLVFTLVFVVLTNIFGLFFAFLLNSKFKGKSLFRALYFFPAVISLVVAGLIFDQLFYHVVPMFGKALGIAALSRNPMGDPNLAPVGVLFVKMWRELPVPTVLYIAGLQSVPSDLIEASVIDGAGWSKRFRNVIFPFLVPIISMNLVLTVRNGIMVFDVIKVMTGGGPGYSTSSIGITIYNMGFYEMKFGMATAVALFLFLIIGIISFIQIKILNSKGTGQL